MKKALALSLLMPLAACSGLFGKEPPVANPAPPGISYRAENNDVASTAAKAQEYCGRYGKKAKQENTKQSSDSTIVTYSCE